MRSYNGRFLSGIDESSREFTGLIDSNSTIQVLSLFLGENVPGLACRSLGVCFRSLLDTWMRVWRICPLMPYPWLDISSVWSWQPSRGRHGAWKYAGFTAGKTHSGQPCGMPSLQCCGIRSMSSDLW